MHTLRRKESTLVISRFPDFLGIGAQKAGTSWLRVNLSSHPEIWMPPLKELHYFDQRIKEPSFGALITRLLGKEYTTDGYSGFWRRQFNRRLRKHRRKWHREKKIDLAAALWDLKFFVRSPSDRWYASLFEPGRQKIAGEVTPEYSVVEERVVAHIHGLMPSAKVIYLLRNPIERVYSSTAKTLRLRSQSVETVADEQLLEMVPEKRGSTNYLENLEKWRRFYPDNQIFVGFLEDIQFYPARLLRSLYEFLEVDVSHAQKVRTRKINPSGLQEKMPTWYAAHLARTYHEDLRDLSSRFGGYASFWLYCAQRLIDDTIGEETVPYPLSGSWLWEEWKGPHLSLARVDPQGEGEVHSRSLA